MSWDSYIGNLLAQSKDATGTEHADMACIIGLDGGAPWTTPSAKNALNISLSEGAAVAQVMKSKEFTSFEANGVHVNGVKYQFLREEEKKIVFAKRKEHGALTIQSSKTGIVIAHVPEGCQQGYANKAVGTIAEYLESMNM